MQKIRKIEVICGVYWVEVTDAKLYILCGCPADSIKHLLQQGLIIDTEKDGVSFETGPNAILLSDIMLQNGHLSNMAEFPVLQMLYRQGMILPKHPNNNGIKPLLIGSDDQIQGQMEYIYRGNYGLISHEELTEAGASAEMADEIMRMKLKFAFGKIRKTEELLDSLIVKDKKVEVRNGVFIQRKSLNIFEISYEDEIVTVNLSLTKGVNYRSAYPLGFRNAQRDYFSVMHSGQGDGWDINRPCMSSILMFQGKVYLIDAGPNLAYCLTALGIGVNEIEGIFQTHCHDDHFACLTTLIRTDHRIKLYATPIVRASVLKKLASLLSVEEDSFSQYFEMHDLRFDTWNDIDGLEVKPFLSPHSVETSTLTFRTFWEGGYLTYAHLADIISMNVLEGMVEDSSDNGGGIRRDYYDKVCEEYLIPADLKKIDIGGGLIHGMAEDFREDHSKKIILAHTAVPLTVQQKEIGSSAPFGVADTLIPDYSGGTRRIAAEFLMAYFPTVPQHHLQVLLNSQLVTFQPGNIILREGEITQDIYLLLTGTAERIQSREGIYNLLASGEIIGEHSGVHKYSSTTTYRTISYVQAMRIPTTVYLKFVKKNRLFDEIETLHENRDFLQRTWLFGESISYPIQNRIAKEMIPHTVDNVGEAIKNLSKTSLYLVKKGQLEISCRKNVPQLLTETDFFGAESCVFKSNCSGSVMAKEPTELFEIPESVFKDIPIVLWKLLETYGKR